MRYLILVADVTLLEFKPSDIAASALLSASHDLFPLQFSGFWRAIFSCSLVNKVKKKLELLSKEGKKMKKSCIEYVFLLG